jgi:hypothetical protein
MVKSASLSQWRRSPSTFEEFSVKRVMGKGRDILEREG